LLAELEGITTAERPVNGRAILNLSERRFWGVE
jgi:hypothetical protein